MGVYPSLHLGSKIVFILFLFEDKVCKYQLYIKVILLIVNITYKFYHMWML